MATFQQRRDPLRLMWRRLGAIFMLVIIAVALRGVWGVYQKAQESAVLRAEAEAKLAELKDREHQLRTDIANLKSERGIEAELRERYDVAGEGEGVIVIVEPPTPPPEPPASRFQQFRNWFSW
ncbi:MAG TPA: septum formation initiator family protein [Candidatus Paceibacterota bacterium]|nr:septum formation initiator family protein [Candidatus Paceibacterota bacterium]